MLILCNASKHTSPYSYGVVQLRKEDQFGKYIAWQQPNEEKKLVLSIDIAERKKRGFLKLFSSWEKYAPSSVGSIIDVLALAFSHRFRHDEVCISTFVGRISSVIVSLYIGHPVHMLNSRPYLRAIDIYLCFGSFLIAAKVEFSLRKKKRQEITSKYVIRI